METVQANFDVPIVGGDRAWCPCGGARNQEPARGSAGDGGHVGREWGIQARGTLP